MHQDDKETITALANGIAKGVLYICLTVFGCMWLSNCTLDQETVISCEESCSGTGSQMESVTSQECICAPSGASIQSIDPWVLPR